MCASAFTAYATQIDIAGPLGSVAFGEQVAVLPNGNIVVVDPGFLPEQDPIWPWPPVNGALGGVYLYDPSGNPISQLTGSTPNDHVGSGGLFVLTDNEFVVLSPQWSNGSVAAAGAATWIDGSKGLSGIVSASNSLVGTAANDFEYARVESLANGNYVIGIPSWDSWRGAVFWAEGHGELAGTVTAQNSLVGMSPGDWVGWNIIPLNNGNYVVLSFPSDSDAATFGNGSTGIAGPISAANSLTTSDNLHYGYVTALTNGNYVFGSLSWGGGRGAVTWVDGTKGRTGEISAADSIVGTATHDAVGAFGITPLKNGNFVIRSPFWNGDLGAATWADGTKITSAIVSVRNSLVGSAPGGQVGVNVIALTNGNYVVSSFGWNSARGAATWGDGNAGISGIISSRNSLVGSTASDSVGQTVALANGNYVVSSPGWNAGRGAATWGNGSTGISGSVSSGNSLVGEKAGDYVGVIGALTNGNYLVGSPNWNGGIGAVSWADGATGRSGRLLASKSLVGSTSTDYVGVTFAALSNGSYVVGSPFWDDLLGATTWCRGTGIEHGVVSVSNSLIGVTPHNPFDITALSDGNYVIRSRSWNLQAGAITLANGAFQFTGTPEPWNTVFGISPFGGRWITFDYDSTRLQLAVGRPYDNTVSLIRIERIFADGYEGQ